MQMLIFFLLFLLLLPVNSNCFIFRTSTYCFLLCLCYNLWSFSCFICQFVLFYRNISFLLSCHGCCLMLHVTQIKKW